ncbi:hypothetical protein DFJ58DRAFT_915685 [Suillus subalutaceus]|uniref:uncharacterized protein n=1 Tax=Suillus subalutaceus TaxID=48586 RepID=UPI001B87EA18|nr:uncharacterized protein DFJ58DRAFT_915685 [Suillus subalutaceus]KAG1844962.1 hypothetical protein DFJ58DRAFT_915685 [Suillus subalutaceus]
MKFNVPGQARPADGRDHVVIALLWRQYLVYPLSRACPPRSWYFKISGWLRVLTLFTVSAWVAELSPLGSIESSSLRLMLPRNIVDSRRTRCVPRFSVQNPRFSRHMFALRGCYARLTFGACELCNVSIDLSLET